MKTCTAPTKKNCPRLLIVYFDLGIGGVQRKIVDIVNRISLNRYYGGSLIRILLEEKKDFTLENQISNPNVQLLYKPLYRMPFWLFIALHLFVFRPHVILTFLPKLSIYATALKRVFFWRKICIILGEDVIPTHSYELGEFDKKYLLKISQLYSRADAIITPSSHIKQELIQNFKVPEALVSVIPNWATTHHLNKKKEVDLVFAGRLDPEKGLPFLINTVYELKRIKPNISLWVIGDGSEKERVESLILHRRLQENVYLLGPRQNIASLLAKAKIAVFASTKKEGLPFFLLEALAAGLPVVSMHYPGINELFISNEAGIVCRSQKDFSLAIKQLFTDDRLRERMSGKARQVVSNYYTSKNIDRFITTLFNAYE